MPPAKNGVADHHHLGSKNKADNNNEPERKRFATDAAGAVLLHQHDLRHMSPLPMNLTILIAVIHFGELVLFSQLSNSNDGFSMQREMHDKDF